MTESLDFFTPERKRRPQSQKSDFQLRMAHKVFMTLQRDIEECSVEGLEQIADIRSDDVFEVTVSHSTGFDVPMTIHALGENVDLAIADQSTHHSLAHEPGAYIWLKLCGQRNYLPISYEWRNGQKFASKFNPEDAELMVGKMHLGKSVMVAAHSPLSLDTYGNAIPPKPGLIAAYLAGRAQKPILPVGVSYFAIPETNRYNATIKIGAPFELRGTADTHVIRELSAMSRQGGIGDAENQLLYSELHKLREDGKTILDSVQLLQNLEQGYPVIDNAYAQEGL